MKLIGRRWPSRSEPKSGVEIPANRSCRDRGNTVAPPLGPYLAWPRRAERLFHNQSYGALTLEVTVRAAAKNATFWAASEPACTGPGRASKNPS